MKSEIRTNQGYRIIESIKIPGEEYVLGELEKGLKGTKYVTWINRNGYYCYGHYMNDHCTALADLYERVASELNRRIDVLIKPF